MTDVAVEARYVDRMAAWAVAAISLPTSHCTFRFR
jgi:hypothetical protein